MRYDFRADLAPPAETPPAFSARCVTWMRSRLAPGSSWLCWIAELSDEIVGTIWLELIEKLPNPVAERERHGYITNLFVRPALRGNGAGTLLLRHALAECESRGVDAVVLWPTPASRSLYQRLGFAPPEGLLERRLSRPLPGAVSPDPA